MALVGMAEGVGKAVTVWYPYDFGEPLPGKSGLIATGTTQRTAQPVTRKVNVFQNIPVGSGAILPTTYSPGAEIHILNRGANALLVYPGDGDQIENYGINTGLSFNPGGTCVVVSFDEVLGHLPRTWWLDVGQGSSAPSGGTPGSDGLGNDNGVLILTNQTGWPTESGLPGSLYNLGGIIGCTPPTTPNPAAPPVVFGMISSTQLLALGGANLPLVSPTIGSNIIWNNGGVLCVA